MGTRHATSPSTREPCARCGEETAVGSVFFSDRRTVGHEGGAQTYLCTLCDQQLSAEHRTERLSDEEINRLERNWSAAVNAFTGGH